MNIEGNFGVSHENSNNHKVHIPSIEKIEAVRAFEGKASLEVGAIMKRLADTQEKYNKELEKIEKGEAFDVDWFGTSFAALHQWHKDIAVEQRSQTNEDILDEINKRIFITTEVLKNNGYLEEVNEDIQTAAANEAVLH